MENIDDSMVYSGIVRREEPNNIKNIKNLSRFDTSNVLNYFDNECNDYEYNLLNNLSIVGYEKIFSFFRISPQDKMIGKFLSTKIICNQKLSALLWTNFTNYAIIIVKLHGEPLWLFRIMPHQRQESRRCSPSSQ